MENNKRREEYWDEILVRVMTIISIMFIVITLVVVVYVDNSIPEVTTYTSLQVEQRIPVKVMFKRYIDSLPVPNEEYQTELSYLENIETVVDYSEQGENLIEGVESITPIVTTLNTSAYCPCEECCGKTDGITSSGKVATAWHTVAAGKDFPIGTIIYVPDLADMPNGGWFEVEDRGGAISNEKLDIFFDTHEEANLFGRKELEVYIYITQ